MGRLLREIVEQVVGAEPDVRIVGEAGDSQGVDALLGQQPCDVVVVDDRARAGVELGEEILRRHGRCSVLVLSGDGRRAELRWLEPRSTQCADVSPAELIGLIRLRGAPGA